MSILHAQPHIDSFKVLLHRARADTKDRADLRIGINL